MKINRIGVDIGKNCFHLCAVARNGSVLWRKVLKRDRWIQIVCDEVPVDATIGMEACGGAHHWARTLQTKGYPVRLIAPQFVKPYVQSNKTDHADAEAIAEAMSRPRMRFVPVKTTQQQDIQSVHRVRDELVKHRTAKANQIRGLVAEFGLTAPVSLTQLRRAIPNWLEDAENGLSISFRQLLLSLYRDLQHFDERLDEMIKLIRGFAKEDESARRLLKLDGIGAINGTALAAALGDATAFRNGRDFAVSLGLTPRQHSTGGKERLLGISKRGDAYLRKQLVHGARAVIKNAAGKEDPLSRWINKMLERRHVNVVTVALAAKMARMAWAMVRYGCDYDRSKAASPIDLALAA